tara:strand:+ start:150 stop:794 length:645 start_codon:yes stop_codon:yes gene_type:complete
MLLITEQRDDIQCLTEATEDGKKNYFIEGIFMQSEKVNRNGRMYERKILFNEADRYNKEYVQKSRAMGELGHPDGPSLNLERVCHNIVEMKFDGDNVMGKAKILDTPYGKIVKSLIDDGVKLGVSTRGMGTLEEKNGVKMVKEDFMLTAVDVVADPSAPDAFVNGIMEGKEWVWNNGMLKEREIETYRKTITKAERKNLEEQKLNVFRDFLSKL